MSLEVSVAYVGLRGISGVLSVATLAVLARAFGPEGYGEIALGVGAALLVAAVVFGPLRGALARFSDAENTDSSALANLFYRGAVAIALPGLVASVFWTEYAGLILAAVALATMQGAFDYAVQAAASGFEPRRVGLLYLSRSATAIVGAVVVMLVGAPAEVAVGWLAASAAIAVAGFGRDAFAHAWTSLAAFAGEQQERLLAFAMPLAVVGVLVFFSQWADRAVVGAVLGAARFGAYVAVADLTQQLIAMLFSGIGAAWYPRLVKAAGEANAAEVQRLFGRYVELLWLLMIPAVVGLAAVAPHLAGVLFGPQYVTEEGLWVVLLVLGAGLAGMKSFLLDLPMFLRRQMRLHASIVAGVAMSSIVIAVVMVPHLDMLGAAMAYCVATGLGAIASMLTVRGFARMVPKPGVMLGVAAGCIAMLASVAGVIRSGVLEISLAVVMGAVTYVVVLWLLNVSDVRSLGRRISTLWRPTPH